MTNWHKAKIYVDEFETMASTLEDVAENIANTIFLTGLREDNQAIVILFNLKGLIIIMRTHREFN